MSSNKFNELVKKRKDWVRSSKENNFDIDSILSGLYNDPSHFIYEILQNAEDAGAKSISFNLYDDYLETIHNAKNDFNFADVDGITGIGISTKRDDLNKIGKFGVGFKSVFAITQSPIIESGQFHFQIDDFVLPHSLSLNGKSGTRIKLPFNHPIRERGEVFELVEKKLQDIGLKTLLFLSNIKEIKWKTPSQNGHYYKSDKIVQNVKNTKKVSIVSQADDNECFEEYLVINKPITLDSKNLKVEIAYKLEPDENNQDQIVSVPDQESKLVVYFPTEKVTYLNFIIQGPFKTTPNRENIPLDDKQNEVIIKEIASLVAESIPIIKKLNFLSTNFLEVLPIDDENYDEPIYSAIYDRVKEKFLSEEKLLPTNHGGYTNPNDSILGRGKGLTRLLKRKDIQLLFNKSHWLDTNITFNRTRELRDYLVNKLGIDEINFENFLKSITEKFIKTKNDKWVIQFYVELTDRDGLFKERTNWRSEGVLRNKPIIRLKNNRHCSPFDSSGKIQVYLPTKTKSSYKTVKKSIAENDKALEFLKKLEISKPDIFAEINEFIIPKYAKEEIDINDDRYFEDIEKLLNAFLKKKSSEKKETLISDLKGLPIIDAVNPTTGENYLMSPSEVYINTNDLRFYFEGFDGAHFINKNLYRKFGQKEFDEFAVKVGCNKVPKRIEIKGDLSWEEKNQICRNTGYNYHRTIYIKDYEIDGLENFFQNITKIKSVLFLKFLLQSINGFSVYARKRFFQGDYCWTPRSNQLHEYFDSRFKNDLLKEKWLFNKDCAQVSPNEISLSELSEDYNIDDDNKEFLESLLDFQLDEIRKIEEKTGGKFIPADEIDDYEQWKAETKSHKENDETDDDDWEPDVLPDEIETSIEEVVLDTIVSDDLTHQNINRNRFENDSNNRIEDEDGDDNDGIPKKKIGYWGEEYVFHHFLTKRFYQITNKVDTELGFSGKDRSNNVIEVKWLNRNRDVGKGYDFVVLENGVEVEYIEVKTTIKSDRTLHIITGTQWEFARKLFNEGDGEKYKIYAVKNANSHNAKIKFISNPIKLWKEGKLYAHPINFRV